MNDKDRELFFARMGQLLRHCENIENYVKQVRQLNERVIVLDAHMREIRNMIESICEDI